MLFDDGSICSRCLRYRRRQLSPIETERCREHNHEGYHPARAPTRGREWYCTCGAESPFDRAFVDWPVPECEDVIETDPHTMSKRHYKRAIVRATVSLAKVGHEVDVRSFVDAALTRWQHDLYPLGMGERRLEIGFDEAIAVAVRPREELRAEA